MKWRLGLLAGLAALITVSVHGESWAVVDPLTGAELQGTRVGIAYSPIRRKVVRFDENHKPGTIVIDTSEKRLHLVLDNGKALRYGVGVSR